MSKLKFVMGGVLFLVLSSSPVNAGKADAADGLITSSSHQL